jgi:hypothetical protein
MSLGLIDKIKERLAEREAKDIEKNIDKMQEDAEHGRKNVDGSINLDSHDFRMPECMPMDVRMTDRIWKNDVEIFLETVWNTIEPKMKEEHELSPEVRELKKLFDRLMRLEGTHTGAKKRWKIIGGLLCFLLEYDLAYRWRLKWALKDFDWSKWEYTPEDAYWLNIRRDYADPPEKLWDEEYIREWQKENYGEILWGDGADDDS